MEGICICRVSWVVAVVETCKLVEVVVETCELVEVGETCTCRAFLVEVGITYVKTLALI